MPARKPPTDGGVDMAEDYPPVKGGKEPAAKKTVKKKPVGAVTGHADGAAAIKVGDSDPVTLTSKEIKAVAKETVTNVLTETAREKLRNTVARIENLEEEKREIAEQIKEVYGEAKAMGYDTKALRRVVRERKLDKNDRDEQLSMFELYWDVCKP